MARKIPLQLKNELLAIIKEKASDFGYGGNSRSDSNKFINMLTNDPAIGGVLSQHMRKDEIRTYIKDGLLHVYSRTKKAFPRNVDEYINAIFGKRAVEIEYRKADRVSLHRFEDDPNSLLVIARGTFVKWETALRKALNCLTSLRKTDFSKLQVSILLVIIADEKAITAPDKETLNKGLSFLGVKAAFSR